MMRRRSSAACLRFCQLAVDLREPHPGDRRGLVALRRRCAHAQQHSRRHLDRRRHSFRPRALPRVSINSPLWLTLPIVVLLHGILFSSLRPLVYAGHDWFVGVILVFATAHIPAIYLARWTSMDHNLAYRVTLLAIGYGFLAFVVLPALIIHAMEETIAPLSQPIPLLVACAILIRRSFCHWLLGRSDVRRSWPGTPIPLDPTKRPGQHRCSPTSPT